MTRYYLSRPLRSDERRQAWEILLRFLAPKASQLLKYHCPKSQEDILVTRLQGSNMIRRAVPEYSPSEGAVVSSATMTTELAEAIIQIRRGNQDASPFFRFDLAADGTELFSSQTGGSDILFLCSKADLEKIEEQLEAADLDYQIDDWTARR